MARLLILVATDPPLVGAAIAAALRQVRPDIDIIAVDPAALDRNLAHYHPDVAITSEQNGFVEASVPSWVRLSPNGGNAGVTSVRGQCQEIAHLHLADLLAVVEQTPCVAA